MNLQKNIGYGPKIEVLTQTILFVDDLIPFGHNTKENNELYKMYWSKLEKVSENIPKVKQLLVKMGSEKSNARNAAKAI